MTKRILSAWAGFLGMALTLVCVLALAPTTDAGLALGSGSLLQTRRMQCFLL